MGESISNRDLLRRIADRDTEALERFYDRHHRMVYALALRIVGEPGLAEEVVLEIFWQIWQQAGRFSPERSRVTTWLIGTSRERALDHLRRLPERHVPARPNYPKTAPDETDTSESDARTAFDSLTAIQRQTIEMAYYRGLNPLEIADALREPEDLVKSRIRAGLGQIRTALFRAAPSIGESS